MKLVPDVDSVATLHRKQRFFVAVGVVRAGLILAPFLVLAGLLLFTTAACGSAVEGGPASNSEDSQGARETRLTVLAAASLTEAFTDMAGEYELRQPDVEVILNFDGSQRLRSQLEHGAQADIFASADLYQMTALQEAGLLEGESVNFTENRLAFLFNSEFAAGKEGTVTSASHNSPNEVSHLLAAAGRPGVKVVLALPQVPAGQYAQEMLEQMAKDPAYGPVWAEGIRANVVSREANVRSVAQKVALGEADAGIAYVTDALPAFVAERVVVVTLPEALSVPAQYPIAATTLWGRESGFIDLILSEEGQKVLKAHGFTAIGSHPPAAP